MPTFGSFDGAQRPEDSPYIACETDELTNVTTVKLQHAPVNVFSSQFLRLLNSWLRFLEVDDRTKAIVITSGIANQFCAGGDLNEFFQVTRDRFATVWREMQELWTLLHRITKPIAAALTGTCPGQGCMLAMACDYRVMVKSSSTSGKSFLMGLNEPSFGVCVPSWMVKLYEALLGYRVAEKLLYKGAMVPAEEAVKIGLVDDVADTQEEAEKLATEYVIGVAAIPAAARYKVKTTLRERFLEGLLTEGERSADIDMYYADFSRPSVQKQLQTYLEYLSNRKHNKN